MAQKQRRIELLQVEADENDQSFFRVLVDGRTVKYITIDPGIFSIEDMCFGPSLTSILPDLPDWDWNDGLVTKDASGRPCFSRASRTAFPGVKNTWHGTCVDYQDILIDERLRTGVYAVK
ncbi:hypothetical protein MPDQ_001497 [Monascus purpureus]|uniref:Uncharacterized protein n=1 Tax=Monascus purpureus TaxID=5098 RepID=A0A507R4W0_MONPU|nr:hypothetical protein MPDQ_001497 [Monascus purpureus]BDD61733.1 hypothetical protein MAP00_006761 [Monascus purpureus]